MANIKFVKFENSEALLYNDVIIVLCNYQVNLLVTINLLIGTFIPPRLKSFLVQFSRSFQPG